MQYVDSSYLESVGYDKANQELYVTFNTGPTFKYIGVSWNTWRALMNAGSHGQYFYHNIRTSYPFEETEPYEETADDYTQGPSPTASVTRPGFNIGG